MRLELQVASVDYNEDGTSSVWLRWLINEPYTSYFPVFPARCEHQNVKVGDWWGISLNLIMRDGEYV